MSRQAAYAELVARRKVHAFPSLLLNPSEIEGGRYDSDHLGPWSRWQGDLNAEVVIVGQDWGDKAYFLENKGVDDDNEQTCTNLRALALEAGLDLGTPHSPKPQPLFLTNSVLGIRAGVGKSGTPPAAWVDDSLPFLIRLLETIQPRAVVSLGTAASRACRLAMYGRGRSVGIRLGAPLRETHQQNPILQPGKPSWFAFYHCGPRGLANYSRELQLQDWRGLGEWLRQ